MKYKVIHPQGFHFGGKQLEKDAVFQAEAKSAHVQTGLHFGQIEPAPEAKAEDPERDAKVKAEEEKAAAGAKAEADAKTKAETDAKKSGGK